MYAVRSKSRVITKIVSQYLKRYLQVQDYPPPGMTEQTIYKDGGPFLICGDGRTQVRNKVNRVFNKVKTGQRDQTNCFSLLKNDQKEFVYIVPGKRYRDDTILEISNSKMAKVVENYLEQRRLRLHEWTSTKAKKTQEQNT